MRVVQKRQHSRVEHVIVSLVWGVVERFMSDKSEWTGTATDLHAALEDKTTERQQARPGWPKDGTRLSGPLRRIAPNMRSRGLDITLSREPGGQRKRLITIAKVAS
jgi:hypothetical protein